MKNRMLGEEVNTALSEVRDRLWNFYRHPFRPDRQEIVDKAMVDIEEECVADFKRNSQYNISRIEPVHVGKAINLIPQTFNEADMWLVDASTSRKLDVLPKNIDIHAKSFRPFIPHKGTKSDKSYFSSIQSSLNTEHEHKEEIVRKIIDIKTGDDGMFQNPSEELALFSPRICLIYCNMNESERMIFMLRPSSNRLTRVSYRAYCYVVMSALAKRLNTVCCNMDYWNNLDHKMKMVYSQSMIVTDSMLVTKQDEIVRYPIINKSLQMERFAITSGEIFSSAA